MDRKGQSAMEYLMTYGWAILVVIIIGVVLWQMGIFDIKGKTTPGYVGFSVLVPRDWSMHFGMAVCPLAIQLHNGAGETLNSVAVPGDAACIPSTVAPGENTVCYKSINGNMPCGQAGEYYEEQVVVTYKRSSDNQSFQTAGTLWGSVEP